MVLPKYFPLNQTQNVREGVNQLVLLTVVSLCSPQPRVKLLFLFFLLFLWLPRGRLTPLRLETEEQHCSWAAEDTETSFLGFFIYIFPFKMQPLDFYLHATMVLFITSNVSYTEKHGLKQLPSQTRWPWYCDQIEVCLWTRSWWV